MGSEMCIRDRLARVFGTNKQYRVLLVLLRNQLGDRAAVLLFPRLQPGISPDDFFFFVDAYKSKTSMSASTLKAA